MTLTVTKVIITLKTLVYNDVIVNLLLSVIFHSKISSVSHFLYIYFLKNMIVNHLCLIHSIHLLSVYLYAYMYLAKKFLWFFYEYYKSHLDQAWLLIITM